MYKNANRELVLDSGASMHLTGCKDLLFDVTTGERSVTLILADGHRLNITTFGKIMITDDMFITNVGYVAGMRTTLVAVSPITKGGFDVLIRDKNATIVTPPGGRNGGVEVTNWVQSGGLFIATLPRKGIKATTWAKKSKVFDLVLWNRIRKGETGDDKPVNNSNSLPTSQSTTSNPSADDSTRQSRTVIPKKKLDSKGVTVTISNTKTGAKSTRHSTSGSPPPTPATTSSSSTTSTHASANFIQSYANVRQH